MARPQRGRARTPLQFRDSAPGMNQRVRSHGMQCETRIDQSRIPVMAGEHDTRDAENLLLLREGRMEAHTEICRSIDSYREKAVSLSHEIHERPELKFREYFAC